MVKKSKKDKTKLFIILGVVSIFIIIGSLIIFGGSASAFPESIEEFKDLVYCIDENSKCEYDGSGSGLVCGDSTSVSFEYDMMGFELPFILEDILFATCSDLFDKINEELGGFSEFAFFGDDTLYYFDDSYFTCDTESNFVLILAGDNNFLNTFINSVQEGRPWDCKDEIPTFSVVGGFS